MNSLNSRYKHLWFPFTSSQDMDTYPPRVIERGSGIYVYDTNGNRYLDAIGSWWVSILGHNHPKITEAVKQQADKLEHVLMAGFISQPTLTLTELLASIVPAGLTRIFFSDDGSTSVEVAMKMALQYWAQNGKQKTSFVALGGGYHGDTLGAMSVGDIPAYHALFHATFKKQFFTDMPYCYRCPCGCDKETCNAECMDSLEKILQQHHETIAACIFEPMVQGAVGMRMYPAKVLSKIALLCREYNVLTIDDEVAMGFGRTGTMFACEHAGIVPDIMCVAKGLTGGYLPMAATITTENIYDAFTGNFASGRDFQHGHTFTGNPLASAAAVATLTILKEQNIPQSLAEKTAFFKKGLSRFNQLDCVGDIRSIGMVGALELVTNRLTKTKLPAEQRLLFLIAQKALDYGIIIRPLGDVIYFIPAYCISEEEIHTMFEAAYAAITDVMYS